MSLVKTSVGLRVEGEDLPWDVWVEFGEQLQAIEGAIQFWIGDWLNYGEASYGEKFSQAISPAQARTWANYAWVARQVPISLRREVVSYSKHAVVAPLSHEEQERFLDECQEHAYTVKQLREAVRAQGAVEAPKPKKRALNVDRDSRPACEFGVPLASHLRRGARCLFCAGVIQEAVEREEKHMTETSKGRRKLLKALGVTSAVMAANVPKVWTQTVFESVNVPVNCQASPPPPPPPGYADLTGGPPPEDPCPDGN